MYTINKLILLCSYTLGHLRLFVNLGEMIFSVDVYIFTVQNALIYGNKIMTTIFEQNLIVIKKLVTSLNLK